MSKNPEFWNPDEQCFYTFGQWVNKASKWLTLHPRYNEGIDYPEPHPFKATCFDAKGRLCRNGKDFMRARDEDAFPVWWIWPDQVAQTMKGIETSMNSTDSYRDTDIPEVLGVIRDEGWRVAVHNDYTLDGEDYTFWLFTKGNYFVKGEGHTDQEALQNVVNGISKLEELPNGTCETECEWD